MRANQRVRHFGVRFHTLGIAPIRFENPLWIERIISYLCFVSRRTDMVPVEDNINLHSCIHEDLFLRSLLGRSGRFHAKLGHWQTVVLQNFCHLYLAFFFSVRPQATRNESRDAGYGKSRLYPSVLHQQHLRFDKNACAHAIGDLLLTRGDVVEFDLLIKLCLVHLPVDEHDVPAVVAWELQTCCHLISSQGARGAEGSLDLIDCLDNDLCVARSDSVDLLQGRTRGEGFDHRER
mmetsp:Transcript_30485/g.74162  ORF Transcript_30485/g.74162 Transcript_30485/m.74162 type:complete len:235 (-) Transcript_30485:199-903(-)